MLMEFGPSTHSQAASLVTPLAQAGISIFAISTYDTDYLLVSNKALTQSVEVLREADHRVQFED